VKPIEKALSIFLLAMGISIIFVWIMLLISGGVPEISNNLFNFIFHWVSEIFLAALSILLSIALILKRKWARNVVFYNLEMAISSTLNESTITISKILQYSLPH
jgi:hypothetical protein